MKYSGSGGPQCGSRYCRGFIAFDLFLRHHSVQKDLESLGEGEGPFKSIPEKRVPICQDDCAEVKEKHAELRGALRY